MNCWTVPVMVMSFAGVFNPVDPKGWNLTDAWLLACATEKVGMESKTRQKSENELPRLNPLANDPISYLHRVLCINRSLDLGRTGAIAWQAGVGRRALNLSNDFEELPRSGPVFDEARVRKLFGDKNRGRYTKGCVVTHGLQWLGGRSGHFLMPTTPQSSQHDAENSGRARYLGRSRDA